MNKAYRLIWSRAKDAWVIAAEIVKGNGGPPPITVCAIVVAASLALAAGGASALPTAPTVVNGTVNFGTTGNTLTINNSPNSIINWQAFSIAANETVRFQQQNALSAVLNRVTGVDPSQILGALQSNGKVFLINPNGIIFGQGSRIDVAGLVASSLGITDNNFKAGTYRFTGDATAGVVKNQGAITTTAGGMVWLISPNVENSGIITSPNGSVMLAAGQSVHMVDPQRPEIAVVVSAPADKAVNIGDVLVQGGSAGIFGSLVSQQGVVNADSVVAGPGGKIFLKSTVNTTLGANSVTSANALDNGDGGKIIVWSDGTTKAAGSISAKGGANGGNGGFIETSGFLLDFAGVRVNASAPKGKAGLWLLDPTDVNIGVQEALTITSSLDNVAPTNVTITTSAAGADQGNITVNSGITWNSAASLTLTADSSVFVNSPITGGGPLVITGGSPASVTGSGTNNTASPGVQINANVSASSVNITGYGGKGADCPTAGCIGNNTGGNGIEINNRATVTATAGDISIRGFGGNGGNSTVVDALGSNNTGGNGGIGIYVSRGAAVKSSGGGGYTIMLEGAGGRGGDAAGGSYASGNGGNAHGGNGGKGLYAYSAQINAFGTGNIVLTGIGGDGGAGTGGNGGLATGDGFGGHGGDGVHLYNSLVSSYDRYSNSWPRTSNNPIILTGTGGAGGFGSGGSGSFGGRGGIGNFIYGWSYNSAEVTTNAGITLNSFGGAGGGSSGGSGGRGGIGLYVEYLGGSPWHAAIKSYSSVTITGNGGNGGIGSGGNGVQGYGVKDAWAGGEGAVFAPSVQVTAKGGISLFGIVNTITLDNSGSRGISFTQTDGSTTYNIGDYGVSVSGTNQVAGGGFSVTDLRGTGLTLGGITTSNGPITLQATGFWGTHDININGAINAGSGAITITAGDPLYGGSINSLPGGTITAGSATLAAKNGITVQTAINSLSASNTGTGNIQISNNGSLSVTNLVNTGGSITLDNFGAVTLDGPVYAGFLPGPVYANPSCDITVIAHSPLTVNAPVAATGNIYLGAGASGTPLDNLLISSTGSVSGQNITLAAGNFVTMIGPVNYSTQGPNGTLTIIERRNPQWFAMFINEVVSTMGRESTDLTDEDNEIFLGGHHDGAGNVTYCN